MESSTATGQAVVGNKGRIISMPKPNNMLNVRYSSAIDFFKWWCIFLRPFIKLTDKEIDVVSSFLKNRWELSKMISDAAILDTMVMSNDTIKKVVKECGITLSHFYVIMSSLKKKGIIKGNIITPELIPNVREDDNGVFRLLIQFKEKK